MPPGADVAANLDFVRRRVIAAAERATRDPAAVTLVAVSKTFDATFVRAAAAAGQRHFGENRVQEGLEKSALLGDLPIAWHLIGHLQSNKARKAAGAFAWIHAVDRIDLLTRIDDAARAVTLRGLMIIPPIPDDPETSRPWFRRLRELRDRLVASGLPAASLADLSMGMSQDFEVAIEEGATIVRVGTAIFGHRAPPPPA